MGKAANIDKLGVRIVTGRLDFGSDRLCGQKYFGVMRGATIGHGTVTAVDATKALEVAGAKAVITADDVPTWNKNILYYGQPVFGVVAEDLYTAHRAASLVNVTYAVEPGVYDPEAAMQPNAVLSGRFSPTSNLDPTPPQSFTRGNIEAGFAEAEITFDTTSHWTNTHNHNALEPRQAVAWWNNDEVYVWAGSQNPFGFKNTLRTALAMPANKVHFYSHGCGGGLGDRLQAPEIVPAACMSRKVGGHPVNLIFTRKEQTQMSLRQANAKGSIKWGTKKDGTIVAASGTWNCCGSNAGGLWVDLNYTYKIPNISWTGQRVGINAPDRGAWRCVQDPPGVLIYNSAMDKLAAHLDMNPWELRMKNIRPFESPSLDNGRVWSADGAIACMEKCYTESGFASKWHKPGQGPTRADGRLHGIAVIGNLDSHASGNGVNRGAIVTMTNDGTALINMGGGRSSQNPTTMSHFTAEALGMKYADVNVGEWGNTDVSLDAGSQGGSGFTGGAGAATVAAALDLRNKLWKRAATLAPLNATNATGVTKATASSTVANGTVASVTITNQGAGYNSSQATVGGVGVWGAGAPYVWFTGGGGAHAEAVANVLDGKVVSITITNGGVGYTSAPTVNISGFTASDLTARDSTVSLISNSSQSITYAQIMNGAQPMSGTGNGWTWAIRNRPVGTAKIGDACNVNGASASAAEVLVDTETGEVEIIGHWNAVETGRTVYKNGCYNQIAGGSELQVNQALYFGDVYDPSTGAMIGSQYTESQMVTPKDFKPANFHIYEVELEDAATPFGARGIAEPAVNNYGVIVCAIYNATGKWVDMEHGACNPDRVLKALGKA